MRLTYTLSLIAGLLSMNVAMAQKSREDYIRYAEEQFQKQNYVTASQNYKTALEGTTSFSKQDMNYPYASALKTKSSTSKLQGDQSSYLSYKLAESYRLSNNFYNAEKWYEKVLKTDSSNARNYPLCRYWYAYCLKANQKYDRAIAEFQLFKYQTSNAEFLAMADAEIQACKIGAKYVADPKHYNTARLEIPKLISKGSTFSTGMVGNEDIVFSSPSIAADDEENGEYGAKPKNVLFQTKKENGYWQEPVKLDLDVKGYDNIGSPVLTSDKLTMYFTAWNFENGQVTESAIFVSVWGKDEEGKEDDGGSWGEPRKLNDNVNVMKYRSMHPALCENDRILIFASDRPGGKGKYDLWYTPIDAQGIAGTPRNMGGIVNTSNDELTPFYEQDTRTLYFSSRGHQGFGGLDIFKTSGTIDNWGDLYNLGYPVSSSEDDAYFVAYSKSKYGYFSSDRSVGCCYNLFQFEDVSISVAGEVCEEFSGKRLKSAKITVRDSVSGDVVCETSSDSTGHFQANGLDWDQTFIIAVAKEGYFSKTKFIRVATYGKRFSDTISLGEIFKKDDCFTLTPLEYNKPYGIQNIYYDFDKATLRPESKASMDTTIVKLLKDNPDLFIQINSHTDSKGTFEYNEQLSQARAQSVVDYLIAQGVSRDKLVAKGFGETMPAVPNENPDGSDNEYNRQLNRRTEFEVKRMPENK